MTKATSRDSTPRLNTSVIHPRPEALADSQDSSAAQAAVDDRPDETPISVSPKPAEGLSRRLLLGGLAVLPAVAGIPTAAAGADAELIALGKKYEILVDRYYAARAVWAPALSAAHIERDTAYEAFG